MFTEYYDTVNISLQEVNFCFAKSKTTKFSVFWFVVMLRIAKSWPQYVNVRNIDIEWHGDVVKTCEMYLSGSSHSFFAKPPARLSKHFPYVQFCPIWLHVSGQTVIIQWPQANCLTTNKPLGMRVLCETGPDKIWQTPLWRFSCAVGNDHLVSLLRMPICCIPTRK